MNRLVYGIIAEFEGMTPLHQAVAIYSDPEVASKEAKKMVLEGEFNKYEIVQLAMQDDGGVFYEKA